MAASHPLGRPMAAAPGRRPQVAMAVAASLSAGLLWAGPARQSAPLLVLEQGAAGIDFHHLYGGPDKGYITEMGGSGGAWIDYDVDGWLDLMLVNGLEGPAEDPWAAPPPGGDPEAASRWPRLGPAGLGHRLYRNRRTGFAEVTAAAGVGDRTWGNGAAVGDVDNDGFPELYVTAIGPNRLYRNNGDGTFSPWAAGVEDAGWGTSAAFTDWDGDGHLDLYVANYVDFDGDRTPTLGDGLCFYLGIEVFCGPEGLVGARDVFFRSRGDGTFEAWPGAQVDPEATYGFALVASDCDDDGRADLYVANDSTINLLYRHGPGGGLDDWSLFSGAGYSGAGREQAGMGVTAGDFDLDGDFDLYVTNFQNDHNTLYRNLGACSFEDATEELRLAVATLPYMGWAAHFLDIDGDGDLDLYVANGHIYPQVDAEGLEDYEQRNLLFLNQLDESGRAAFTEARAEGGLAERRSSRSVLVGDPDNDGDLDLLVTQINGRPSFLRNAGPMRYPALRLTLVGRSSNRSGYGARVVVDSGGRRQWFEVRHSDGYLGSNDPRLLVFLPGGRAQRLEVRWPSGVATVLEGLGPSWVVVDELRGVIAARGA